MEDKIQKAYNVLSKDYDVFEKADTKKDYGVGKHKERVVVHRKTGDITQLRTVGHKEKQKEEKTKISEEGNKYDSKKLENFFNSDKKILLYDVNNKDSKVLYKDDKGVYSRHIIANADPKTRKYVWKNKEGQKVEEPKKKETKEEVVKRIKDKYKREEPKSLLNEVKEVKFENGALYKHPASSGTFKYNKKNDNFEHSTGERLVLGFPDRRLLTKINNLKNDKEESKSEIKEATKVENKQETTFNFTKGDKVKFKGKNGEELESEIEKIGEDSKGKFVRMIIDGKKYYRNPNKVSKVGEGVTKKEKIKKVVEPKKENKKKNKKVIEIEYEGRKYYSKPGEDEDEWIERLSKKIQRDKKLAKENEENWDKQAKEKGWKKKDLKGLSEAMGYGKGASRGSGIKIKGYTKGSWQGD